MTHSRNGKVREPARRKRPARPQPVRAGSAPAAPSETASNGRTARGTFALGNSIAKGNPFARKMAALRAALLKNLDEGKLAGLADVLYAAAVAGDWTAAELLLRYAIGRPTAAVNPDTLDHDEFRQLLSGPSLASVFYAATQAADPRLAVELWAGLRPPDADALWRRLDDECRRAPETFDRLFRAAAARAGK
jgi:hypothetical protein